MTDQSVSSTATADSQERNDGNGLVLAGSPFGLEKIYDYNAGGHHPVHLGDLLGPNKRYKVMHKLGNGGFANVWLCRDLESGATRYVALKVLMAESSGEDCAELRVVTLTEVRSPYAAAISNICRPLADFRLEGPNGLHVCIVYPVLGPKVSRVMTAAEDRDHTLRVVAYQATSAMALLHSQGICHGDFTASNMLLRTTGLDGLSEQEVIEALGEPVCTSVTTESGATPSESSAPGYLVHPVNFDTVDIRFVTAQACLIDFGESFEVTNIPEELGIPQSYRSPELLLDGAIGIGCDLWALGCTLFEIRTGRKLFATFDDDDDDYLFAIVLMLGPLPEPWWTTWQARRDCFEDRPNAQGQAVKSHKCAGAIEGSYEPRSIREALSYGLEYDGELLSDAITRPIPAGELELFADLLSQLLKYEPSERISAAAALEHEWFRYDART